jgi:uncharacterized membrane protein
MRAAALAALSLTAALTACNEPSAPETDLAAARKPVRQITVTDLQFPGDGAAWDINNAGQIVGDADQFGVWRKGSFHSLALPPNWVFFRAAAVNASAAMVGEGVREGQQGHALLWDNGRLHDLGVLPGDVNSEAHAMNARGDIVGVSRPEQADRDHAVLWRKGQMIPLGALPGDIASEAWGIDDAGRVVGESRPQPWPSTWRPFMWKNGVMTELTELKQPDVAFSYTRDGIVAWKCPDPAGAPKSARRVGVITYIPCPTNAAERKADVLIVDIEDINSSGQAVGTLAVGVWDGEDIRYQVHAYLWWGKERFVLPPMAGQPEVSMEPHAINDRGEIVGHSSITVGATLWTIR